MLGEKSKLQMWLHILVVCVAMLLLLAVCSYPNHSAEGRALPLTFYGEYSLDGGPWQPLQEDTSISALDGDLILRGHFDRDIAQGSSVFLYLDHISCSVRVNQAQVMCSSTWEYPAVLGNCSTSWLEVPFDSLTSQDTVEIHLHNAHRLGNADAYELLLSSMYSGSSEGLKDTLTRENWFFYAFGIAFFAISVGIIGIALAFTLLRRYHAGEIWFMGLLGVFFSSFVLLDISGLSLWSNLAVFNTYAKNLCMMLSFSELAVLLSEYLTGRLKKAALAVFYINLGLIVTVILACFTGQILIVDTLVFWVPAQMLLCLAQLALAIAEWIKQGRKCSGVLISCVLLLCAMLAELANEYALWWTQSIVAKLTFCVLYATHLIIGICRVPERYRDAEQTVNLEKDLKNSRIVLAMSQIRTHFVFNILNAISGMCKYDPHKADDTVIRFARYLRSNIDVMEKDEPESFSTTMRQLEDYVALEQVRFGDKIRFVTDISVRDFKLPPLLLQPLVENAIKHGLMPKTHGGTIVLRTWQEGATVLISICDDGIGFRPNHLERLDGNQSVGLKNVRFRLETMVKGSMDIESTPGKGTTVIIRIPREEEN